MFDILGSADLLVARSQAALDRLGPILGLYEPRGVFHQVWPDWGFDARWCRVNLDVAWAPTHVEIIAPFGDPDPALSHPFMADIYSAQEPRAYRTHSTPVAVADIEEMIDRIASSGARFRIDEPAGQLPFRRVWMGRDHENPGRYDASSDGGLYLEFVPTESFGFPTPEPDHVPKGTSAEHPAIRVARRTMLVPDLDQTLRELEKSTGWVPDDPVEQAWGGRRARLPFTHPRSAVLEVVQPVDPDSRYGQYFAAWGPGPVGLTLEVADLDAAIDHLQNLGVGSEKVDGVVLVDTDATLGVQVEFAAAGQLP